MTDYEELFDQTTRDLKHQDRRVAELKAAVAELTEMLTAATDTAMQRGKVLDKMREACDNTIWILNAKDVRHILDGADGG